MAPFERAPKIRAACRHLTEKDANKAFEWITLEFTSTPEQLAIKDRFAEFAHQELNEQLIKRDQQSHF